MTVQPFAQHLAALKVRAYRHQVLSSNIANADTPNYKARDIDFGTALKNARTSGLSLKETSDRHIQGFRTAKPGGELKYRIPTQPSLDGNTVEADVEQTEFAENAIQYRACLTFLNGAIQTLRYAIRGGD